MTDSELVRLECVRGGGGRGGEGRRRECEGRGRECLRGGGGVERRECVRGGEVSNECGVFNHIVDYDFSTEAPNNLC